MAGNKSFFDDRVAVNECLNELLDRAAEMSAGAVLYCEEHSAADLDALLKGVEDGTASAVVMVRIGYTPPHVVAWGSLKDGQFKPLLTIPMDGLNKVDTVPVVCH
jgi:hypothetical protein